MIVHDLLTRPLLYDLLQETTVDYMLCASQPCVDYTLWEHI